MKKITILAVIAVAVISASCRKDRTCTCTDASGTSKYTKAKQKKGQFRTDTQCYSTTTTSSSGGGSSSQDCKLE